MARVRMHYPPCTSGIAIGTAHIALPSTLTTPHYWILASEVRTEQARLKTARSQAHRGVVTTRDALCSLSETTQRDILDTHIAFLEDDDFVLQCHDRIAEHAINAEWAVEQVIQQCVNTLGATGHSTYLRERQADIQEVGQRIIRTLLGAPDKAEFHAPYDNTILFTDELSPAETITLPQQNVAGIVTARGSTTSHTAIVARSAAIPAILGAGSGLTEVQEGDAVIIDAEQGLLIIRPTATDLQRYRRVRQRLVRTQEALLQERDLPAQTIDGYPLALQANIELLEEIATTQEYGAEGIGLYRTEYLFMHRSDLPSEDEQYEQYKQTILQMAPHPVTIRTLDIGGDKLAGFQRTDDCTNPALGLRAIRFCLRERTIFLTQLRALYRASIHGPLKILLPLISGPAEINEAKQCIAEACASLQQLNVPFDATTPLGVMIEVPSAVMLADQLAKDVDFFSIGTNDLTQYALAVDRGNPQVRHLYQSMHPAILRMIHHTVSAAQRRHIPVSICGEMASDPLCTLLLLGLELSELSMHAFAIPRVKQLIRRCHIGQARNLAAQALQMSTASDVEQLVRTQLDSLPEPALPHSS